MSIVKRVAAVGASVAAVALLSGAPTASAKPNDVINTFRNQGTNRCIDDTNEGGFRAFACNGTEAQQWNVRKWADGTVELRNIRTGRCMDDSNAGFRTLGCNTGQYQSWFVRRWNDGTIELKNQATGRCIDDTFEGGFRTWDCNASPAQSWF